MDFRNLVLTKTWSRRDTRLEKMEYLYSKINHASKEGIVLCFALAKVYDDIDDVDKCFNLLVEGNQHHSRGKIDTIEDARTTITAVKRIFSTQAISSLDEPVPYQPIFILGMPRSGTSLVEQILAAHSLVYGGGELKMMGQWCAGFVKGYTANPNNFALDNYLKGLKEHYLKGLKELNCKEFVTDKMPPNFIWIGFILSAIPTAKIIHTIRDPMAVCWSNYKTDFVGSSNGYSCNLNDTGEFYKLYADLMEFWYKKFPGKIYDLNYEQLTLNQEEETRKLLDYCGLNWEDACLEFHKTLREVKTASQAQVKRPMYQGSSESWKRYKKYLGPLQKSLSPIV